MNAPKPAAGPPPLTFQWPEFAPVSWPLAAFIALSLLAHALTFYIFQIEYPPASRVIPPPAQVSVLAADSPENEALLRWLDAEDPALAAKPPQAVPPGSLDVAYTPSYSAVRAVPGMVEKPAPPPPYPAVKSGVELIAGAPVAAAETPAAQPRPEVKTQLRFSGGLVREPSRLAFVPTALTELLPARFLVGVSGRGETRYVFLRESSGDKGLDKQAETLLRSSTFAPPRTAAADRDAIHWGFATFAWGADVFTQTRPAAVSPAP